MTRPREIRDLAVVLADGGDAICDCCATSPPCGQVASGATAFRVFDQVAEHELVNAPCAPRARWFVSTRTAGTTTAAPLP